MPISAVIYDGHTNGMQSVITVGAKTGWQICTDPPGVAISDGSPVTNPNTQIANSYHHLFRCNQAGSHLIFRLAYDVNFTSITTEPVINVFGRCSSADAWMKLKNRTGSVDMAFDTDLTNDVSDGTYRYTTVDQTINAFDLLGCNEFLVGTTTALAGVNGSPALSFYQFKFVNIPV